MLFGDVGKLRKPERVHQGKTILPFSLLQQPWFGAIWDKSVNIQKRPFSFVTGVRYKIMGIP